MLISSRRGDRSSRRVFSGASRFTRTTDNTSGPSIATGHKNEEEKDKKDKEKEKADNEKEKADNEKQKEKEKDKNKVKEKQKEVPSRVSTRSQQRREGSSSKRAQKDSNFNLL